jgi:hypothetical protein
VRHIITVHVRDEIRSGMYSAESAQEAATSLSERIMIAVKELTGTRFKIIVTVALLERAGGSGLHTVGSAFYDAATDSSVMVRTTVHAHEAVVQVFGISM